MHVLLLFQCQDLVAHFEYDVQLIQNVKYTMFTMESQWQN